MTAVKRDYRLDLLRVIANLMIVLMHSPLPNSAPGFVLSGISYLTSPGIGLFFMISGALLLGNNLSSKELLKRRFTKILYPTLVWSFFYLVVRTVSNPMPTKEILSTVLSIPFSPQGHGVLWFMYTLAGLYLLTPILSQWLRTASKREVEFYLFLWGITIIYPYLNLFLTVNEDNKGILYYFAGYVGYYILGYYINRYYKFRIFHVCTAIVISVSIPIFLYSSKMEFDFYSMLWYLSLPVALMAFCWYVMVLRMTNKYSLMISEIAKLSFGIYLVHFFIMRSFLWKLGFILALPGLIQIPVIAILTFGLSFFVSWIISKLSFSKYIIGV